MKITPDDDAVPDGSGTGDSLLRYLAWAIPFWYNGGAILSPDNWFSWSAFERTMRDTKWRHCGGVGEPFQDIDK